MSQYHTPVLLEESVGLLAVEPAGTYADLTFGGGGHSRRILSDLGPEGRLYGFDQDRDTLENRPDDARFHYVESNFRFLRGALRLRGVTEVDGILADLGVSSHHFDAVERGFSFRGEAPLDMRMNQRGRLTAADVVNDYTAEDLTRILGDWGEVETPWKVANCLVKARAAAPVTTTAQLVGAVKPCTPKKDEAKFLTKLFQALRIEVNGEMEALKMALEPAGAEARRPAGRYLLPFARRQAGEEFHAQRQLLGAGRKGLFRSFAGPVRPRDAQGRDPFGRRTRPQSPFPFGETPGGRKTLIRCTETTNSTR